MTRSSSYYSSCPNAVTIDGPQVVTEVAPIVPTILKLWLQYAVVVTEIVTAVSTVTEVVLKVVSVAVQ